MMPRSSLALALIATTGCASAGPAWLPFDRGALPPVADGVDAVRLDNTWHIRFGEVDGHLYADQTRVTRTLIAQDRGRDEADYVETYAPTFERVLSAHSRLIRPDGTITEKGQSEMVDALAGGGSIAYTDDRGIISRFDVVPRGSVAEHHFTVRHDQPELFTFFGLFGESLPTARAAVEVEVPAGFEIEHLATRAWQEEKWDPEVTTRPDGARVYRWAAQDLPALEREDYAPGIIDRTRLVWVRIKKWTIAGQPREAFGDMASYGRWVHQIQGDAAQPDDAIRAAVATALTGVPDSPRDRARALYGWVQDNVRYVAVEVGMGGWAAHPARQVLANKYGDCKDKATLLKSMLDVAGIESRVVLLYAHDGVPRQWFFPTIGLSSNHMILAIDLPGGETVFVDPTTRTTPFGELPPSDQGATLMVVGPQSTEVVQAPVAAPGTDARTITLALTLPADGDASGTYQITASGATASALDYQFLRSADDRQRVTRDYLALTGGRVAAEVEQKTELVDGRRTLIASGKLTMPSPIQGTGGTRMLRLDRVLSSQLPSLPARKREHPLVFWGTESRAWSVRLELPPNVTPSLPAPVTITDPSAEYQLAWSVEGRTLIASVRYVLKQRTFPAERYDALRELFDRIAAAASAPVILREEHK